MAKVTQLVNSKARFECHSGWLHSQYPFCSSILPSVETWFREVVFKNVGGCDIINLEFITAVEKDMIIIKTRC